jgi:hypothetical protein
MKKRDRSYKIEVFGAEPKFADMLDTPVHNVRYHLDAIEYTQETQKVRIVPVCLKSKA